MPVFELEEQRVLTAAHQNRSDEIEEVHARDVKTLQAAEIYTCNRMKSFTEIKGHSEAKAVCWPIQFVISSTKCVPIAERFGIDAGAFLDNMFYACAYTYEHQYNLLLGLATKKSQEPFRLLVIDPVIALFRVDFAGRELAESQNKLSKMMSLLMKIPKEFNIAVYMTDSAPEVVPEVIADPGKGVFNGADARVGRRVNAGTVGGTSGIDGSGAGPGGGAGNGGVAGTDGGVAGTDGGVAGDVAGTDGGVAEPGGGVAGGGGTGGAGGDGGDGAGGGGGGGGDDDDDEEEEEEEEQQEEEEEEEEEGAAASWDNIPPNQDVLARIGVMRLCVKEFEAMVKGDEFQTEVLKFAADRNLLSHLLEGQQLDNIPNIKNHFLGRTDFIKEL